MSDSLFELIKNIDHIFEIEKIPIINGLEKTIEQQKYMIESLKNEIRTHLPEYTLTN